MQKRGGGMADIRTPDYELAEKDYMLGMKYKDIAEKYNVSINTVKSWKQRYKWNRKGVHTKEKSVHTNKTYKFQNKKYITDEVKSVLENEELTDKQRLFCIYYNNCFNATKAYQKAYGCDYITANTNGPRLLVKASIKDEIHRLKQGKLNKVMLSDEDIFQKYINIAFSDISDYVEFGKEDVPLRTNDGVPLVDGNGEGITITRNYIRFKDSSEVDGTIINEVSNGKNGVKVKLEDRMKALDWLSKHMEMATEEQKVRIAVLKAKVNLDDNSEVEDDGFINALTGKVDEIWQEE